MNHTPGWEWQLNKKFHQIELRDGGNIVMDFVRYGMNRAAPRFNVNGLMYRADEFAQIIPGEKHHADWRQTIDNPIARLLASAPRLLEACRAALDDASAGYERHGLSAETVGKLAAAIALAEGREEGKP